MVTDKYRARVKVTRQSVARPAPYPDRGTLHPLAAGQFHYPRIYRFHPTHQYSHHGQHLLSDQGHVSPHDHDSSERCRQVLSEAPQYQLLD